MKVYVVNLKSEEIEGPYNIRTSLLHTVQEFKNTIAKSLQLVVVEDNNVGGDSSAANKMRVVQERYYSEFNPLHNLSKTLKDEGFYRANKVSVILLS